MNSLSWLLYLADVCDSLDSLFVTLAAFCGFAAMASLFGWVASGSCKGDPDADAFNALTRKVLKWAAPIFFCASLFAAATPEKETFYAIAASELGESVLKSPTVTKAQAALDAWLDKQIAKDAPAVEQK